MTDAPHIEDRDLRPRLAALSLEEKVRLLTGADFWTLHPAPGAGLGRLVMSDGPNGVRGAAWGDERDPSLLLPNTTALAATWDTQLVERAGRMFAEEARRKGAHVLLAPTINIHRSPLGGRHFECFSEDPLLTSRLAVAYIRGVQSGGVAACAKHFVGNDSETERMRYDARIDERTLREVYLAPFEATVREAGVWAVMAAYNGVNGATMTANEPLLRGVLKEEWGFDGVVVSDWMAARSTEESALAGLDVVMPGPRGPWGPALVAAVEEDRVPEEVIDEKVLRLLRLAARVGVLDAGEGDGAPETAPPSPAAYDDIREISARSFVLLRNEGDLLPLQTARVRRIALIGPATTDPTVQGGGSAQVSPPRVVTPAEGLRAALPEEVELVVHRGTRARRNLAPLAPGLVRDPEDGSPGLRVEFLDGEGNLLRAEHRDIARLVWIGDAVAGSLPRDAREVVVRARMEGAGSGIHTFSVAGVGVYSLQVDGEERLNVTLSPESRDPVEALQRPPEARVQVEVAEGTAVELEARHVLDERTFFAVMNLGHEPPVAGEEEEISAAVEAARRADVAVVMVGTMDEVESEGFDRSDLLLPGRQDELVRRVAEANPNTVVVVNAGAPVLMPWTPDVPAVLWTWFGGQEYGAALADVLLGVSEPGGRLPTTFPSSQDSVPVLDTTPADGRLVYDEGPLIGYRAYDRREIEPAYGFGHGLSYTTWDYESITVEHSTSGQDPIASVRVKNTGLRPAREVVQCYAEPASGAGDDVPRRLAGFAVAELSPGESAVVAVSLSRRALDVFEPGRGWRAARGTYRILAGRSSRDLRLEAELRMGEVRA
jgi:beta-glucosidase